MACSPGRRAVGDCRLRNRELTADADANAETAREEVTGLSIDGEQRAEAY